MAFLQPVCLWHGAGRCVADARDRNTAHFEVSSTGTNDLATVGGGVAQSNDTYAFSSPGLLCKGVLGMVQMHGLAPELPIGLDFPSLQVVCVQRFSETILVATSLGDKFAVSKDAIAHTLC
jgi:hypothetical protein